MDVGSTEARHKLRVFITVDTEVWPSHPNWRENRLLEDIDRHLYCLTPRGEVGVRYQLRVLKETGLKAVFLTEPLFAKAAGLDPLSRLVSEVLEGGHEVGLQSHAEWVQFLGRDAPIPSRKVQHMKDLTEEDQYRVMEAGLELLDSAGAPPARSHRAGNYTANLDTLRALVRLGIPTDTSYNYYYPEARLGLPPHDGPIQGYRRIEGVAEYPISQFLDRPGSYRHAQIAAVSNWEFEHTLGEAWRQGRPFYVIVSHSFEFLKHRNGTAMPEPNLIVKRRFERLCQFLADNRDRFETSLFQGLPPEQEIAAPLAPLRSNWFRTGCRMVEQALGDRL